MESTNSSISAGRFGDWACNHRKAILWTGGSVVALVGGFFVLLAVLDWNQLRGPISRYASARTGREIAILGDLDVKPLSLQPSATINGLRIGNPAWAGKDRMAQIERVDVQVKALPLLLGKVDIVRLELTRPDVSLLRGRRRRTGRPSWDRCSAAARQ